MFLIQTVCVLHACSLASGVLRCILLACCWRPPVGQWNNIKPLQTCVPPYHRACDSWILGGKSSKCVFSKICFAICSDHLASDLCVSEVHIQSFSKLARKGWKKMFWCTAGSSRHQDLRVTDLYRVCLLHFKQMSKAYFLLCQQEYYHSHWGIIWIQRHLQHSFRIGGPQSVRLETSAVRAANFQLSPPLTWRRIK